MKRSKSSYKIFRKRKVRRVLNSSKDFFIKMGHRLYKYNYRSGVSQKDINEKY